MSDNPQSVITTPAPSAPAFDAAATLSRKWTVAALLMVMVLASMETTVTSTAMPTIVGALQGLEHYSWVASIYLLASTATMPIYGRLADILGRKRVLLAAIGIFFLGSLLAFLLHLHAPAHHLPRHPVASVTYTLDADHVPFWEVVAKLDMSSGRFQITPINPGLELYVTDAVAGMNTHTISGPCFMWGNTQPVASDHTAVVHAGFTA